MFAAQISVDSVFETLGIDAVLDPDGAAIPVKLIPREADGVSEFGAIKIISAAGLYEIRVAEFAGYGDGAVLDVGGVRRQVQSHFTRDLRRLKVVLDTVEGP